MWFEYRFFGSVHLCTQTKSSYISKETEKSVISHRISFQKACVEFNISFRHAILLKVGVGGRDERRGRETKEFGYCL
jgi:hypothetical protein